MAEEPDSDRAAARSGHIPVFLDRTLELFRPVVDSAAAEGRRPVIVDGTLARLVPAFDAVLPAAR